MRVPMLAGNWKMNKRNQDLAPFFADFTKQLGLDRDEGAGPALTERVDIVFAVPYTLLATAAGLAEPHGVRIAAQSVHWEDSGAFTGEVSVGMLEEIGVTATLIGHSERRQYFGETDESVAKRTKAALTAEFMPIVCVGETLAEREAGTTGDVVKRQVQAIFAVAPEPNDLVIAYEPVWAIGTGRSATSAQAQEVHALIRRLVRENYGDSAAAQMRILYGGSASPANIDELMAQPDIDGGLVGGASLKPGDFARMVKAAL